jgi:phosphonatase-like hydrolase
MTIQLVVFDLAGTTVSDDGSVVNQCFREILAAHGIEVDAVAVNAVMGLSKPEALRILLHAKPGDAEMDTRIAMLHDEFVAKMGHYYATDPHVHEIEGVSDLFFKLRQNGVMVGLNTGFGRVITNVVLDRMGWTKRGLIDGCVSSGEVPQGRPHPFMIEELMRRLHLKQPSRVAKVGDSPADLEEGANADCGMNIGVTWGSHTRAQLEPYPHTDLVDTMDELAIMLLPEGVWRPDFQPESYPPY